jgi:hypothetical protein
MCSGELEEALRSSTRIAVHDELADIVDPFTGTADDVGVFAEGEPHDYGIGSIAQRH